MERMDAGHLENNYGRMGRTLTSVDALMRFQMRTFGVGFSASCKRKVFG
jgi:hypothetical protein